MNAPRDIDLREVSLDDKYTLDAGTAWLTGTQALVRLPLMQRRRDVAAGHNTAGYISGYRGSPVGGYDQALQKARKELDSHHVRFVPGINEDLAATAIWGTQQVDHFPGARYDGVFGIWYGKGPGVDRSGDALRHANQGGTSPLGGVLAVCGDDHGAKSSTVAAQVDFLLQAVSIPVLAPATVQDYLDMGLHGLAMSRYAGLWVGLKAVTDTIETAGVVDVSLDRVRIVLPTDFEMPPGGVHSRVPEEPFIRLEERLVRFKLPAALAYARANRLDRNVFGRADGQPSRLGIVATGKAWLDTMQALADLGIDQGAAEAIGLKVYKVAMPWPLEPTGIAAFCEGCDQVLVVEEKRSLVESQLKELLYRGPSQPVVWGKRGRDGNALLPENGELDPGMLARTFADLLRPASGTAGELPDQAGMMQRIDARIAALDQQAGRRTGRFETIERIPYFCSGCPHNTSTKVPEGSRAMAGIGCSYMAVWMDRSTATTTQMGAEGMTWVGQAPFTDTPHVFQNLGDGTYFHSGSLAVRAAVASRTRITYKILFNDAVAMTGGQRHDGVLSPQKIARQMRAEGVERIEVVTDEPDKYPSGYFDADVSVHHRRDLDTVQRALREYDGVSVLIYDQTCAAEKRRRRKRGEFPDPARRVFINEAVCEGCGDCGVKSNCVSVEPVETEFGRKRVINQSTCNKDFSCVEGFCPSFVSIEGGRLKRSARGAIDPLDGQVFPAVRAPALDRPFGLIVTGIGGTGVVTIGQILGMAAHLEGKAATVLDMAGLAQKNGAVTSFVRFARTADALHAPRIGPASADALLGCDLVVSASRDVLARLAAGRAQAVVNVAAIPTGAFTRDRNWRFPRGGMESAIVEVLGDERAWFVEGTAQATALFGDAIATNMFMLGQAFQRGMIPLSADAIEQAIVLNEVAADQNRAAFRWGRRAAVEPEVVQEAASPVKSRAVSRRVSTTLDELIARRVDLLTDYQDERWARRYLALVRATREAESALGGDGLELTHAVARNFAKLMSYKDEYEVARLYTSEAFRMQVAERFEGDFSIAYHLAPPILGRRNAQGELVKRRFGPWMGKAFGLLAPLRRLRGTMFDPFGRTAERRTERRLIDDYEARVKGMLARLTPTSLPLAVKIAAVPDDIRGFGHVKERSVTAAEQRGRALAQEFERALAGEVTPA